MSTTPDTKQDHPGPEWVSVNDMWWHPGLDYHAETVEEARAISAAALHWERMKAGAAIVPSIQTFCPNSIEIH